MSFQEYLKSPQGQLLLEKIPHAGVQGVIRIYGLHLPADFLKVAPYLNNVDAIQEKINDLFFAYWELTDDLRRSN